MITVLESLNQGLRHSLQNDECVVLLGEDIIDPYGGAFKVTRGLSTEFPRRVMNTPISEAGFTGLAIGMALGGLRPVVEIMFGDFVTLIADQIINHAVKFRWMYNEQVRVPLVIRTPMGGRRGYGPTHSQTLEKLYLGVPGLSSYAPSTIRDPGNLLSKIILNTDNPVLFIENKLQYVLKIGNGWTEFDIQSSASLEPVVTKLNGAPPSDLTIATYGYMSELVRQAVLELAYESEVFASIVIFEQLSSYDIHGLITPLSQNGRLLVVEEGTVPLGWGAEVVARACEALGEKLKTTRRIGARFSPIPSSGPLEEFTLPGVSNIIEIALEMVGKK
jgi:pyruvate/2-oxoglutarate/acetoin dehydrogenase E1 component